MRSFGKLSMIGRSALLALAACALAACALATTAASASAASASASPGWEVNQGVEPSEIAPGTTGYVVLSVYDVGGAKTTGSVTVTDKLPPGLTATEAGYWKPVEDTETEETEGLQWTCSAGTTVTCTNNASVLPHLEPGEMYWLVIVVEAAPGVSGSALNEVTVAGGGAPASTTLKDPITFGTGTESFGYETFATWLSNANGTLDTQAGSHPYELTTSFFVHTSGEEPVGEARNVIVKLPPGLIGNPTAVPECTAAELNAESCPADTQIGVDRPSLDGVEGGTIAEEGDTLFAPQFSVYNMVPPPGMPAQFGFSFLGIGTRLDAEVRSGSDYGISERVPNIPQNSITFNTITIWGVPAEASHNFQRCGVVPGTSGTTCGLSSTTAPVPLLTLPTSCSGPERYSASAEPWETLSTSFSEISFLSDNYEGVAEGLSGCERLAFKPSIEVAPDTSEAESPAGLTVEVKVPQEGLAGAEQLAAANIKDTTVTLPEGVAINPGQATGLAACTRAEAALEPLPDGREDNGPASCPSASQVGVDEIKTPLLHEKLEGSVYLLESNPPNIKLLVTADGEGVSLKLVGTVHLNEQTGRLTTTFSETPELPFTLFKLSFSGGARAALTTPARCGTYTTTSDFTPWSTPATEDAFPTSAFVIDGGPDGTACAASSPFSPSLTAGATTDQAGGFTNFSMLLTRTDGQQRIASLQFKTPPGLLGEISKVTLCEEPQAASGDCPAASQIGHTTVEAGPGPYPLVVPETGKPPAPIYITGPYDGAPFGLSIAVPVVVGPFNLGTVVVRGKIEVNSHNAQLTITTGELPQIIDGVPTDLRDIDAVIERPEFMINPTNCEESSFSGTATSAEGATAAIASRFQVGSCRSLKFSPGFTATSKKRHSRKDGAYLHVKVSSGAGQANIRYVKVELPKALPSRLSTLQQACTEQQFASDPSGCPAGSIVGEATAKTPVLPNPLSGPAYFVSHGGAKFPELIVVLQGEGVTVYLEGETFISKRGVTSSTFKTVPDVPVSDFELTLPTGPHSALGATQDLCRQAMYMPTTIIGQNNATVERETEVEVAGCPDAIVIDSHRVKGRTLRLSVTVPTKGKLSVSGKGIATETKTATNRETLKLKLRLSKQDGLLRKLDVKLGFVTQEKGKAKRLHKKLSLALRR